MIREVVKIDEALCDGCGVCIPNCHEGALQIIDGKARLISDLMCDGLGACLGHCPQDAITIEKREAEPYNETEVMKLMVDKGEATVIAHLVHLKEHNEMAFFKEGITYLKSIEQDLDFSLRVVMSKVHAATEQDSDSAGCGGGCPGSAPKIVAPVMPSMGSMAPISGSSELRQWPVQMHLVSPQAAYFQKSDLLVAADCVAFSVGNFHSEHLKGKSLAIACPKLDSNQETYLHKLVQLIDQAQVNTITVMIMEVPCCGGLLRLVQEAVQMAERKVPLKAMIVSTNGQIIREEWI